MQTKKEYQLIYVALDLQVENSDSFLIILFLALWYVNILTLMATFMRNLETLNMVETFPRFMMLTVKKI